MSSILNMFEDDFEKSFSKVEEVDQGGIATVAKKAKEIAELEAQIAQAEEFLKIAKKDLLKKTDEDLPALMQELGIQSFTLDDGSKIDVKPTYGAYIKLDDRPMAFDWLRDNGFDDIIKNTVSCTFGRGEDDKANSFKAVAENEGLYPEQKEDIHAQTLKAWVRERVETGDSFPMELFGAYVGQRAFIKKGK